MAGDDTSEVLGDLDVAVAHWHVNAWGGAEYLVTKLAEVLDVDRIYTTGDPSPDDPNPYGNVEFYDVTQDLSFPRFRRFQNRFGRVFEYALWEDVDWREYGTPDILVTSGSTTRAVITPDETLHVNYCHSPPRWLYDRYHERKSSLTGVFARPLLRHLRMRDATVDRRVDHYFANSPIIQRRIEKFYDRDSTVLYPPLDLEKYYDNGDKGFYLHLGRLDEEKGVPAIVEAFEGSDRHIVFAGSEGDINRDVRLRIGDARNMEYRGFVTEEEKLDLLATCRAVVFNGQAEDFGIVPIEANASGKACLVRDDGFPGLFIEDGHNGYCHEGKPEDISECLDRFESDGIGTAPQSSISEFSIDVFERKLRKLIDEWNQKSEAEVSQTLLPSLEANRLSHSD